MSPSVRMDDLFMLLYRLAFPLCGAHGRRTTVYHGFLRASSFSLGQINPVSSTNPRGPYAQIIMFSDLECDYINPIDLCNKLNQVHIFFSASGTDSKRSCILSSVCPPRKHCPRLLDNTFPGLWAMDCIPSQRPTTSV